MKVEHVSRGLNGWSANIGHPAGTPAKKKRAEARSVAYPVLFQKSPFELVGKKLVGMPLRVVGMNRLGVICSPCLPNIASHFGIDGDTVPFSEEHPQVIDAVFAHALHL